GEGANWIGEAPFSTRRHVFQNLGDGTYNHSGILAIRAALAAGVNITYKILFNDAVAMTGGQPNEGDLTPDRIVRELRAMGVNEVAVVHDEKEEPDRALYPQGTTFHERAELLEVERRMQEVPGVSAIVYVQTCAAEKRRRRKRGLFPDPDLRAWINPDVCEGCGDCGVQSNCVSIVPVDTELGRKRAIDQSSCNKDFSCLNGFCPSFVTVEGARIRKAATVDLDLGHLPMPELPEIRGTHNVVITGVGGTGVVTIGAILAQAAYMDGKGAAMMEMAGLAQKGGAVHIHCRIANAPEDISAVRVATGEADCVIGGDLVVTAGAKTLGLMQTGRTGAVVNAHEIITGDFTRDPDFRLPADQLRLALEARLKERVRFFDASALAEALLGDAIFSNMIVFGAAWQAGLVPVGHAAIVEAIRLNGTAVDGNLRAFEIGRWATVNPDRISKVLAPRIVEKPKTLDERVAFRAAHLTDYQSPRLARRYQRLVERAQDPALKEAIALGYHKLLAYKDEYEVARLHLSTAERLAAEFEGDLRPHFHLAPPLLSRKGPDGRPKKRSFGPWILRVFRVLAGLRGLRGTPLDPFGYTAERRLERRLIREYERDMKTILDALSEEASPERLEAAVARARLPLSIRGFGPVKMENARKAEAERAELMARFAGGPAPLQEAAE
ncbi:MAG: indolepyruvate ferredoxin oxidoreductase family protein, partial [Alphaproteobacteria bacterium]